MDFIDKMKKVLNENVGDNVCHPTALPPPLGSK